MTNSAGNLVIIGGAEDKEGECIILQEVVKLAGGRDAKLLVLTAATRQPEVVGNQYRQLFTQLGAAEVGVLDVGSRAQADDSMVSKVIKHATGIFFTGGDQLRITSMTGGTTIYRYLKEAYAQGIPIAGTSAGASVMSATMIVQGTGEQEPKKWATRLAPGLGLLPDVVIDQHFAQRGRLGRLLSAVAQNPYVLGIGVDENTALVVKGAHCSVLGTGTVTIIDGQHISYTNTSEVSPADTLALTDVRLHVLSSGYGFDLNARQPYFLGEARENTKEEKNS